MQHPPTAKKQKLSMPKILNPKVERTRYYRRTKMQFGKLDFYICYRSSGFSAFRVLSSCLTGDKNVWGYKCTCIHDGSWFSLFFNRQKRARECAKGETQSIIDERKFSSENTSFWKLHVCYHCSVLSCLTDNPSQSQADPPEVEVCPYCTYQSTVSIFFILIF